MLYPAVTTYKMEHKLGFANNTQKHFKTIVKCSNQNVREVV